MQTPDQIADDIVRQMTKSLETSVIGRAWWRYGQWHYVPAGVSVYLKCGRNYAPNVTVNTPREQRQQINTVCLSTISVDPKLQRKGIAMRVTRGLRDWALAHGAWFYVESVIADEYARALKREGFESKVGRDYDLWWPAEPSAPSQVPEVNNV